MTAAKNLSPGEHPREKFLQKGAESLSDAELLSLLLPAAGRRNQMERARSLLQHFGGLRRVLAADQRDITALPGFGPASDTYLKAALELSRRYLLASIRRRPCLNSPRLVHRYLRARLRDLRREIFLCMFLDNRHALIACQELFQGSLDGACIYPRHVVEACLQHNAAAVIFAHNHPSGYAEPSRADERITRHLQEALALVDVRVVDHIVVGEEKVTSFAERGLL